MLRVPEILDATAAYGRRYFLPEDVLADWRAGKDFKLRNGPYFSIREAHLMREGGCRFVWVWGVWLGGPKLLAVIDLQDTENAKPS